MSKTDKPISSPDSLTKTSEKAVVELTEEDLDKVVGGAVDAYMTFEPQGGNHK